VLSDSVGPFNLAAEPVIGPAELAAMLHARLIKVSRAGAAMRTAAAVTYRLRLQPVELGGHGRSIAGSALDAEQSPKRDGRGSVVDEVTAADGASTAVATTGTREQEMTMASTSSPGARFVRSQVPGPLPAGMD
jgi:UDP-glucose 4-epimerase